MNDVASIPIQKLKVTLPRKFAFLMEMHPYKVAWGGRFGLKSHSFARALLALGANQPLRIVCGRQVMKTLDDSVHALLSDTIKEMGLERFYRVMESEIRGRNGTHIGYAGLGNQTAVSIKSFEAVDIFWVEEAQNVREAAWQLLLPTIRAENSEVWVSFNPEMDTDPTYKRFVEHPPPGTVSVHTTYEYAKYCGFFTGKMEELRLHDLKYSPDDYANIWLGEPRTAVVGAIYTKEIATAVAEGRFRPMPYDPRMPVDTIWDLGWNDMMSIIMVQKPTPTTVAIINYREANGRRYDQFIDDLNKLGYRWGTDWLPHDATQHHPTSGTNAEKLLRSMNRRVKIIPRTDPEARIKAARMLWPRTFIDNTERQCDVGVLGGGHLVDRLKRYKRNVPTTTNEPSTPTHDLAAHAADAFGGLAEIVDQIKMEFSKPPVSLPGFTNVDPSMGLLG